MKRKKSLGLGFADELLKVTTNTAHFKPQGEQEWTDLLLPNFSPHSERPANLWRPTILFCFSVVVFFIILLRLFHLQIVKGSENRNLAEGNRIQIKKIHAPRGVIYDRNSKILAQNQPGFRLVSQDRVTYLTRDEVIRMEVMSDPELKNLEIDSNRDYPLKEKSSHIIGFMGEITPEELKLPQFKNYLSGDRIGRGGIEESYEKTLKGVDGGEVVEVDSSGRSIRTLRRIEPIAGESINLTIDGDLQIQVFGRLKEAVAKSGSFAGAAIAEDPSSGQILSLVSLPSFDPSDITSYLSADHSPILNRAIAGRYPPGSIFKIVSSLAGLTSGKITPQTEVLDTGVISLGKFTFSNWYFTQYGRTEGSVNIVKAIKRSNDTYFYRLGEIVGEEAIAKAARELGFGKRLNIDIPGEEVGVVPDNGWKIKNLGEVWFPGDTLHLAIGQGFVTVTPLEISNLISVIAMDGRKFEPHLNLKKAVSETKISFKKADLGLVKEGLSEVPKSGGTAWPFFSFPIETAGKTGTAEFGDVKNRTHAWYTSFAPVNDPKIAMTVLIEGGGEGSNVASPVVKEIYRWYFSPDKNNLIKDIFEEASPAARKLGE